MTLRIYILILLLAASATRMCAENTFLKHPLTFVSPDSVMTWGYTGSDFRTYALRVDSTLHTERFEVTADIWKNRRERLAFGHKLLQNLNVVGGGDDELRDTQGLPAIMNIASSAYLFLLTGRAVYVDAMERSLYNAVNFTAQNASLSPRSADRRCALQSLMTVPGWIYAVSGNSLYVNLYTNSTARIALPECRFMFDQITSMPTSGTVKFRISRLKGEHRFAIRLRIPDWAVRRNSPLLPYAYAAEARPLPKIYVSGHEWSTSTMDESGYITIERTWRSLDEIYIEFPAEPQYVRRTDAATGEAVRGEIALQAGPQVFVVQTPCESCYFSSNSLPQFSELLTAEENKIIVGTMYSLRGAHADAAAPGLPFTAVPYAEARGDSLTIWCREMK